jgi:hypothetical protein
MWAVRNERPSRFPIYFPICVTAGDRIVSVVCLLPKVLCLLYKRTRVGGLLDAGSMTQSPRTADAPSVTAHSFTPPPPIFEIESVSAPSPRVYISPGCIRAANSSGNSCAQGHLCVAETFPLSDKTRVGTSGERPRIAASANHAWSVFVEPFIPLLTTEEAARFLRLHPVTLRRWRQSGAGPRYFKEGDVIRYRLQDLDNYVESRLCQEVA